MQNSGDKSKKYTGDVRELLSKISRLRKKLACYGYSSEEIISIILEEFLKLKKIQWENLNTTTSFYDIKSQFRTDSSTTQMIMCLQKIVPNLHAPDVCQYLLRVLQFNALAFGFNLIDSSSDSNQSNSALHHRILHNSKRRIKNPGRKQKQKRSSEFVSEHQLSKSRKKIHKTEKTDSQHEGGTKNKEIELDNLFSKRPSFLFSDFDHDIEKQLRIVKVQNQQFQQWKQQEQSESEYGDTKKNKK